MGGEAVAAGIGQAGRDRLVQLVEAAKAVQALDQVGVAALGVLVVVGGPGGGHRAAQVLGAARVAQVEQGRAEVVERVRDHVPLAGGLAQGQRLPAPGDGHLPGPGHGGLEARQVVQDPDALLEHGRPLLLRQQAGPAQDEVVVGQGLGGGAGGGGLAGRGQPVADDLLGLARLVGVVGQPRQLDPGRSASSRAAGCSASSRSASQRSTRPGMVESSSSERRVPSPRPSRRASTASRTVAGTGSSGLARTSLTKKGLPPVADSTAPASAPEAADSSRTAAGDSRRSPMRWASRRASPGSAAARRGRRARRRGR